MRRLGLLAYAAVLLIWQGSFAAPFNIPVETVERSRQRHQQVAARRQGVHVICHRGASEFAHENTLEAYRATFELGGDGNEIDQQGRCQACGKVPRGQSRERRDFG